MGARTDRTGPAARRGPAVVVMPTFDEALNLERVARAVLAVDPEIRLLVVDDASPDGTGELADRLAAEEPRISVLHRAGREGLGHAYLAGFARALDDGAAVVLEMDADGSHPAAAIPALLARLDDASDPVELVIGSRRVPGGRIVDWPWYRRALSDAGNGYARRALALPARDVTAGFRAFRAEALRGAIARPVDSRGYCFQIDLTRRVHEAGGRIAEVPIEFREREHGRSKMSPAIVAEAMLRVTAWGLARRFRRVTR
ncbi:MAG: polyprenol monophosphomannose synthase [Actinomycetales bacterium]|nr:polyprenol monophosphomannose synthase [Actinomycetales bacterium]